MTLAKVIISTEKIGVCHQYFSGGGDMVQRISEGRKEGRAHTLTTVHRHRKLIINRK